MAKDAYGVEYYPTHGSDSGSAPTSWTPITIVNGDGTTSQGTWTGQATKN